MDTSITSDNRPAAMTVPAMAVERMLHGEEVMTVLGAKTVVGVFASAAAAELARGVLLEAGVPESRIALSSGLTDDALAAEAPGQAFENQPGQAASDAAAARYAETVRTGACVVSVFTRSEEEKLYVEQLLLRNQAHSTTVRP